MAKPKYPLDSQNAQKAFSDIGVLENCNNLEDVFSFENPLNKEVISVSEDIISKYQQFKELKK